MLLIVHILQREKRPFGFFSFLFFHITHIIIIKRYYSHNVSVYHLSNHIHGVRSLQIKLAQINEKKLCAIYSRKNNFAGYNSIIIKATQNN